MVSRRIELPDNLPACHAVIIRQAETIERLELRIDQLNRDVTTLKRKLYGSRRERFVSQEDAPQAAPLIPQWRRNRRFSVIYSVRRESRRSPVGANPIRPIGRSAGSNQSDEGGNEFVEVLW